MRLVRMFLVGSLVACTGYEFDPDNLKDQDAGTLDTSEVDEPTDDDLVGAEDDAYTTKSGFAVRFDPTENDSGRRLNIVEVTDPDQGGSSRITDRRELEYTSASDFVGTESFDYTIEDRNGEESTATITFTVDPRPTIEITSPKSGAEITGSEVEIAFVVTGCTPSAPSSSPEECHIHMYVDGAGYSFESDGRGHYSPASRTLEGLEPGERTVEFRLVTNEGTDAEYDPRIADDVDVTLLKPE